MDFFNEHIVKKKKDAKDWLFTAAILLLGWALFLLSVMFIKYTANFIILIVAAIIYGEYYFITGLSTEYEYVVINGEMDVDKISAKRSRKRLLSVNSKDFEYFAPLTNEHKNQITPNHKIVDVSSSLKADNLYFALYFKNNQKICLVFEPTDKMIEEFSKFVAKTRFFR